MNKNTVIGLVLIFGLMVAYSLWFAPDPPEPEQTTKDTTVTNQQEELSPDTADATEEKAQEARAEERATAEQAQDTAKQAMPEEGGSFMHAARGENTFYIVENELFRLKISKLGGRIAQVKLNNYETYDSLPVYLFTPDSSTFSFDFYNDENRVISTGQYYFEPVWYAGRESEVMTVEGDDSLVFGMRLYAHNPGSEVAGNGYIEFRYTIQGDDYMLDMDVSLHELDEEMRSIYGNNMIDLKWAADLRQQEKSQKSVMGGGSTIFYRDNVGDVNELKESGDDQESIATGVQWIGFKQRFFNTTLWSKDQSIESVELKSFSKVEEPEPGSHYLKSMEAVMSIPYETAQDHTASLAFYFGPNDYQTLNKYKLEMQRMIPLGWGFFLLHWINRFAVIPVFNYLEGFNFNYGIIILILTVLLKLLLFPIAYKTYKSSARMRVLKPEIEEIGKKYPKKEDAMKKQQATMALYKKAGVNPMAGCLPLLLQMPILFAMFRFFPSSIELRGESFLWAHDLSTYDSIAKLPFEIPFYGDHVSLFTLLMAISTVLYTWVNQQNMNTGQQMPGMKTMMYMMPVMLLFIFNSYASGLSYYYFLANIITFIQMIAIRRFIDEDAIRAKIQANKKKPVKKSKFQQRLEQAAKQQQQAAKSKKR